MGKIIFKKTIKIIFILAITLIGGLAILTAIPWKSGLRAYVILSGSMEPTISTGSMVIAKETPAEEIKVGEVIAFRDPKDVRRVLVHRVTEITKGNREDPRLFFTTKGDANNVEDSVKVSQALIIGRVTQSFIYLGYLLSFIRTPLGILVSLIIPSLIIGIIEIINFKKHLERHYAKKYQKDKDKKSSLPISMLSISLTFLIIGNFIFSASGVRQANAAFTAQLTSEVMTFKAGDWVPPDTPTLLSPPDDSFVNTSEVLLDWSDVLDYQETSGPTYYLYRIAQGNNLPNILPSKTNESTVLIDLPEGTFWWQVKACDQKDNCSEWSSPWSFKVDTTPPIVSLSVTGSNTYTVEEKIDQGDFESGDLSGWDIAGDVVVIDSEDIDDPLDEKSSLAESYQGNYMVKIGSSGDSGNFVWENRLMKSINGAKNLSLRYNFYSRDYYPYDDPGFFIRINGNEVFKLNPAAVNPEGLTDGQAISSSWQQQYFDISRFGPNINLAFYGGNNTDTSRQSWVYLDKITTYFVATPGSAVYTLNGSDNISGIDYFEYKIDDEDWQRGDTFTVPVQGNHNLQYRAWDKAGISSLTHLVETVTDNEPPSQITDLSANAEENMVKLTWTAPGNNGSSGKASYYDIRYSENCQSETEFNFDTATKVQNPPSPQNTGEEEELKVSGLNPDTSYCFALKAFDEAPNGSTLSNIAVISTLTGEAVNPGDIIINELMWMGTSVSEADEFLELRNITNHPINLDGFKFTKLNPAGEEAVMDINLESKSIPAKGFFVIANGNLYSHGPSGLKNTPDLWDSSLDLSNSELQIKLYSPTDTLIDIAWDGTTPTEGIHDDINAQHYSMERASAPGDGTNPLNWYTCLDIPSEEEFFDSAIGNRATPGSENRSVNLPINPNLKLQPELKMGFNEDLQSVKFTLNYIRDYQKISYTLTYLSEGIMQGVMGEADLDQQDLFTQDNIILGTCSSGGTCRYDKEVTGVSLTIILTNALGESRIIEGSLPDPVYD